MIDTIIAVVLFTTLGITGVLAIIRGIWVWREQFERGMRAAERKYEERDA
jgi:hypothetical protein